MKMIFSALCFFASTSSFATQAVSYRCEAPDLVVSISSDSSSMTVEAPESSDVYKVVRVSSKSGDSDQTFETAEGLRLTIDEQYGDSLTLASGEVLQLTCH